MNRLSAVVDPELGGITDLNMVVGIDIRPVEGKPTFESCSVAFWCQLVRVCTLSRERPYCDVTIHLELTVPGCPASSTIVSGIENVAGSYSAAHVSVSTQVDTMSEEKA